MLHGSCFYGASWGDFILTEKLKILDKNLSKRVILLKNTFFRKGISKIACNTENRTLHAQGSQKQTCHSPDSRGRLLLWKL